MRRSFQPTAESVAYSRAKAATTVPHKFTSNEIKNVPKFVPGVRKNAIMQPQFSQNRRWLISGHI